MKSISDIIKNIKVINHSGDLNKKIEHLSYDTRNIKKNSLFFATDGTHFDGHTFIEDAIKKGAVAILCSKTDIKINPKATYIWTDNVRYSMASVSADFYDNPAKNLKLIGVTGTDGKSSTVSLISQLLELCGKTSGFISTVEYKSGEKIYDNPYRQSTPEACELQKILSDMLKQKTEYGVLEATSHGLSNINNRLGGINFNVAVLTNISHEHLEFHKTMQQYIYDKANLFRKLDKSGFAVINFDDANMGYFIEHTGGKIKTYSLKKSVADLYAFGIKNDNKKIYFNIKIKDGPTIETETKLSGIFNIYNILASVLAVHCATNIEFEKLIKFIPLLKPIKGRMNKIDEGQEFNVIVDYAHTPGSFEIILPSMRATTKGKIITLFGSGGERDVEKRPIQGDLADRYSDYIILTDEDPRFEDSMKILNDIKSGIKNKTLNDTLFLIPDREEAIRKAFALAKRDDTVLLLGKGHESCIIKKDKKESWSEIEVVKKLLNSI